MEYYTAFQLRRHGQSLLTTSYKRQRTNENSIITWCSDLKRNPDRIDYETFGVAIGVASKTVRLALNSPRNSDFHYSSNQSYNSLHKELTSPTSTCFVSPTSHRSRRRYRHHRVAGNLGHSFHSSQIV